MLSSTDRWSILTDIFESALTQPPDERSAYVLAKARECDLDPEVRESVVAEVQQMLAAHAGPALDWETGLSEDTARELPDRIGAYRIVRRLASGGMGEVLLAERADETFQRQVAIKIVNTHFPSRVWIERFRREQEIHARLQHPNIAQVLDAGLTDSGAPYLVMDYVDGLTIADYSDSRRSSLRERLRLITQVCDAVAFAHSHLILHRDIKPTNIMVDSQGQVKLLDFGIAKLLDEGDSDLSLTKTGQQLMTPRYASPEQIRGQDLTVSSDTYSLGVVLYELLTGKAPFEATNSYDLSDQILHHKVPTPAQTVPELGQRIAPDLQAICLKALEKSPQQRYATAGALADDLRLFMSHRTINARRPNWFERLRRFIRRHPIAAPMSALAIVAVLTGASVAVWQAKQAALERDLARAERDRAEQVTAVLTDLFDSDPFAETEGRRDDLTLREFLLSRAEKIGPEFEDRPQLQGRLFQLFANLLMKLSLLDQAEPYAERAVQIQRSFHPDGVGEPLALALNALATLRQHQANFVESEALFREVLAIREQLYGERHALVANSLNNLGTLLNYWGDESRVDEELQIAERQLAINIDLLGPDSLQAALDYNSLGASYASRGQSGDIERALEYLRKALAIRQRQLGQSHPSTATVLSNIANMLHDLGRLEQADELFRQAEAALRNSLGDNHTRVADVLYGHGHLLLDLDRPAAAVESFGESIQIYRQALQPDHPYVADTIAALGRAQLANRQLDLAISTLQQAIDALAKHPHLDSDRHQTEYRLAVALRANGENTAALAQAEGLLDAADDQTLDDDLHRLLLEFIDNSSPQTASEP